MARLGRKRTAWRRKRETELLHFELGGKDYLLTERRSFRMLSLPIRILTGVKVPISPIIHSVYDAKEKEIASITSYRYITREGEKAIFVPRIDVHPDYRLEGFGAFLVNAVRGRFGKKKLRLKAIPAAVEFWKRMGFEKGETIVEPSGEVHIRMELKPGAKLLKTKVKVHKIRVVE